MLINKRSTNFFAPTQKISFTLSRYVSEQRAILQRETAFEWFQWLSEQMTEREKKSPPTPAHIAHRAWQA